MNLGMLLVIWQMNIPLHTRVFQDAAIQREAARAKPMLPM